MSGPKSSRYTLTAEQLKIILEEQERLRKELEEKARKERESKEAKEYISDVEAKTARFLSIVKSYEQKALSLGESMPAQTHKQYLHFYATVEKLEPVFQMKSSGDYRSLIKARDQAKEYYDTIAANAETLISSTRDWLLQQRIQKDKEASSAMQFSFASVGVNEETKDPGKEKGIKELKELVSLNLSDSLINEVERVIEQFKAIEEISVRDNFRSITIEPLKKRCYAADVFRTTNADRFAIAIDKYRALCTQLGEKEKAFEFTEEGLAALEEFISGYEQIALRQAEQSYISRSVDEVMQEMGYKVVGQRSVHKKSGRSFRSKLLTYEDGTVVNVTEASDGRITMEIGGVDDTDRLPDANERVSLQKTMEAFCKDFKEIERRLSERGVILDSRLSMAPPEEAYAQIINYTDYELVEEYKEVMAKKPKAQQSTIIKQLRNE